MPGRRFVLRLISYNAAECNDADAHGRVLIASIAAHAASIARRLWADDGVYASAAPLLFFPRIGFGIGIDTAWHSLTPCRRAE